MKPIKLNSYLLKKKENDSLLHLHWQQSWNLMKLTDNEWLFHHVPWFLSIQVTWYHLVSDTFNHLDYWFNYLHVKHFSSNMFWFKYHMNYMRKEIRKINGLLYFYWFLSLTHTTTTSIELYTFILMWTLNLNFFATCDWF